MARRTPLHQTHRDLGARFLEFAGWEMPLSYTGAAEEHRGVREHCGLFDVSHMGEIEVRGPDATALCQALTVNDATRGVLTSVMGGVEYLWQRKVAFRAGGGWDALARNAYLSAGLSYVSTDGAVDVGARQEVAGPGATKETFVGAAVRLFVPQP